MTDLPAIVLSATIWGYWGYVTALAICVRWRTRKAAGIVPIQPLERLMWVVWVPLVGAWMTLPYLAATRSGSTWGLPEFARHAAYSAVRSLAAAVAIACLALSVICWRTMSASWRMAVMPGQKTNLITAGPYSRVRHPIYALSMLLMLATVIVVPTGAVIAIAIVHIALMIIKAQNEERYLIATHGAVYEDYRQRTGRFLPVLRSPGSGRFNLFQRMMLRWRELHPYNPVHVVHVPAALDVVRLHEVVAQRLQQWGLTGLIVDRERWRFRYAGGPAAVALAVVPAGADTIATLTRVIESEINQPFEISSAAGPFRFVAIDDGTSYELALAYDHFIASGDSIAQLLTSIASVYLGGLGLPLPQRYPPTYRSVFFRHPWAALRALLDCPRLIGSARRTYRPPDASADDLTNGFAYLRLDSRQTHALDEARRAWGVTLNDLLLVGLMQALSPLAAGRRDAPRRTELAVASILNMRSALGSDPAWTLSPFLSAFRVGHPVPDGIGLKALVDHVHAITVSVRGNHRYLQSIVALALSALSWRFLDREHRIRFYPKHYPAWAGLSTLNVDRLWAEMDQLNTSGLDYVRAAPTGPLVPMVVAVTAVRGQLHVGVSFRTSIYSRANVDRVAADFVRSIDGLCAEFR